MEAVRSTGRWEGDFEASHADGKSIPIHMTLEHIDDDDIGFHGVVGASVDIRERRQLEENLAFQALHDPVTGLPNRRLFVQHLERALGRASRTDKRIAVLFIDLDDFKLVNDRIGHAAGDQVLHRVGAQIGGVLRAGDLVARLGGDEFVVCCDDLYSPDEAYIVAKRIIKALGEAFRIGNEMTTATASIGIALSGPASRPEGLLRNADVAMYAAKQTGKARVELFDDALHAQVRSRNELGLELEKALERGQIETLFQPLVSLSTGALTGFEALARWPHPERGMVSPVDFIAVAEETGMILPLGIKILTDACRALGSWIDASPGREVSVAVNVSGRQLSDPGFPAAVRSVLEETGVPASRLCLEVTETSLVDADVAAGALWELKELGVDIAIDDFGTGYSSLSRLHRFPLDFLKIDRSFVSGMSHRTEDAVIVSCVLALARGLGVRTIAEGIEEESQLEQLAAAGCEFAQGWLWSAAVPLDRATDLVCAEGPLPRATARSRH
jgi:diguanylate cyclase (GGDEF)-like protein